ncbi:MAG: amidohydrolase [Acidimicrobiia bacterium]|nr:amidohydrolase [Acidimicrobiia bacterium]
MSETSNVDLVIRGGIVLPMDDRSAFEGDVAVKGGEIVALGAELDVTAVQEVDAAGRVVLPGLVNAHTHECMERGWFEDLPFDVWLNDHALPKDRAYTPADQRAAALLNQAESIVSGVTTFVDMFRFPGEAASVAVDSGLRAVIAPQLIDSTPGVGETLETNLAFFEEWHGAGDGRVSAWFGPHAPYSCSGETLAAVGEAARARGTGIATHLAESRWEDSSIREKSGLSPAAYLDQVLGLGADVLVAHAVHVDAADIQLLADRDVAVAHCPTSNMKLGNGIAPIPELLEAGIRVGIGTDSIMTNNNLDLFEEMRQAALVAKLRREDPAVLPAWTILEMATIRGAEALGLADKIGTLEVGKRADLILIDLDRPHLWPLHRSESGFGNLVEHLVYSARASDVVGTVVDGQVLMADSTLRTLDLVEIRRVVQQQGDDLLRRAGAEAVVLERLGRRQL